MFVWSGIFFGSTAKSVIITLCCFRFWLGFKAAKDYPLLSKVFLCQNGLELLGVVSPWFLLDIAFYTQNMSQKDTLPAMGIRSKYIDVGAFQRIFETLKGMFIISSLVGLPNYWFKVLYIFFVRWFCCSESSNKLKTLVMSHVRTPFVLLSHCWWP